jgi:multimeric flavodoxin WrbA
VTKTLILHDLSKEEEQKFLPVSEQVTLLSALPEVHHCVGCFGCWVKTPGRCVIDDRGAEMVGLLATHEDLITISRSVFGWLSPEVKVFLDRSIGFLLPFFTERNGGMHHGKRYNIETTVKFIFYGANQSQQLQLTAKKIAKANAINLLAQSHEVIFCPSLDKIPEILQ